MDIEPDETYEEHVDRLADAADRRRDQMREDMLYDRASAVRSTAAALVADHESEGAGS